MRACRAQPSIWNVFVTISAMFYLACFTRALARVLYYPPGAPNLIQDNVVMDIVGAFLGILLVLTWTFLIRDLIRQARLLFKGKAQ